jgi:hypothetical protein
VHVGNVAAVHFGDFGMLAEAGSDHGKHAVFVTQPGRVESLTRYVIFDVPIDQVLNGWSLSPLALLAGGIEAVVDLLPQAARLLAGGICAPERVVADCLTALPAIEPIVDEPALLAAGVHPEAETRNSRVVVEVIFTVSVRQTLDVPVRQSYSHAPSRAAAIRQRHERRPNEVQRKQSTHFKKPQKHADSRAIDGLNGKTRRRSKG